MCQRFGEASCLELTHQLLDGDDDSDKHDRPSATYAIPGAGLTPSEVNASVHTGEAFPLSQLLKGLELPSTEVCDFLFNTFLDSVHWFMMVFHEPSFREVYEEILRSRTVRVGELKTVMMILIVLIMGARYASMTDTKETCVRDMDLERLWSSMLDHVKIHFFDVMDDAGIESVQLCILLGSFYMYSGRPNLSLAVLGAGIRCAQGLNLHKESSWGNIDPVTREVRKRIWWALYVFDRFACVAYGRPSSIRDSDCDTPKLCEMDDTNIQHPYFRSVSRIDQTPITVLTYQNRKFDLYEIGASILSEVYVPGRASFPAAIKRAIEINNKLVSWYDNLPPELRLDEHKTCTTQNLSDSDQKICKIFTLQALALQLAYDNIQIVLHRPFLRYNIRSFNKSQFVDGESDLATSTEQCFHSALRTCKIGIQHRKALLAARETHSGAYLAIQNFAAGMILCMIALSKAMPLHVEEAKQGVAYAISLQRLLAKNFAVSAQTVQVLERLLRLIFNQEMALMLENAHNGNHDNELGVPTMEALPQGTSTNPNGTNHSTSADQSNSHLRPDSSRTENPAQYLAESENRGVTNVEQDPATVRLGLNMEDAMSDPAQWEYLLHDGQIDQALHSIQEVIGNSTTPALRSTVHSRAPSEGLVSGDNYRVQAFNSSQTYAEIPIFDTGNPLTDGQYWIWNVNPL
ncbi:hypothetical protein NA57DRAFT_82229 [Rhizodiscina lignyota]|uniref:Xylanolytic transcriptional activator regulatory domain-containing protein n=1 Tax=Rhizodiscina lignyota TaxID=1504668 RepID=A0A9P4I3V7_9PEZI|nr:hypothetical protein NA57DRAFT_82229 [Rhizodiscina lignyota]